MDATDFRLLALLHEDGSRSQASLARATRLSPATVTRRLARLRDDGILLGFWTHVNPGAFGRRGEVVAFTGGRWTRKDALAALALDDVEWVSLKHDGNVSVGRAALEGGDADALARTLRRPPAFRFATHQPVRARPSRIQWRILAALVEAPRASPERLARACHLSPKTVRRHLRALRDAGVVDVQPTLGASSGAGVIVFHLGVFGRPPSDVAVRAALPGCAVVERLDGALYVLAQAPELASVEEAIARVRGLPGVREARLTLNREMLFARERVLAWIAEAARPSPTEANA